MYKKMLGEKINLRKITSKDAQSIYKNARDKEVAEKVPLPTPYTLENAKSYIKMTQKFWHDKKETQFGMEDKNTKKIIGMIGLMHLDFDLKTAEVGYWLGKNYWGKGIASEALQMILKYAFEDLRLDQVYAQIYATNIPSIKLVEKCRFKFEKQVKPDELFNGRMTHLDKYVISKKNF